MLNPKVDVWSHNNNTSDGHIFCHSSLASKYNFLKIPFSRNLGCTIPLISTVSPPKLHNPKYPTKISFS